MFRSYHFKISRASLSDASLITLSKSQARKQLYLLSGDCNRADICSVGMPRWDVEGRYWYALAERRRDEIEAAMFEQGTGSFAPVATHMLPMSECVKRYHRRWSFPAQLSE